MKRYLTIAVEALIIIFLALILLLVARIKDREIQRLTANQTALMEDVRFYVTKDSMSVAQCKALSLSRNEFRRLCAEQKAQLDELGVKVKRLKAVSNTTVATGFEKELAIRDSVVVRDTVIDTVRCVSYSDEYVSFSGCVDDSVQNVRFESVDSLTQVVSVIPKRFLFIRYGCKGIQQTIVSRNPYTRIIYTDYIEIKK